MFDMIVLSEAARKLGLSSDGLKSLCARHKIALTIGPKYARGHLNFLTAQQFDQLKILHAKETLSPTKRSPVENLGGYAGVSTRAAYEEIVAMRAELKEQRALLERVLHFVGDGQSQS